MMYGYFPSWVVWEGVEALIQYDPEIHVGLT